MADDAEARKTLLEQAGALGLEVDGRWSVETLAEKVQEAQDADRGMKTKAVKDASDTWVFLHRDAFPVDDEKHLSGEIIRIPKAMANYWAKHGVARAATEDEVAAANA